MAFEDEEARQRREQLIETFDNAQDTDKRVAALNNLVDEVRSQAHPHETDAIVAPVTRALKAAQQALSLAALAALPTLVGTLGHASHLSRALAAWLPLALERGGDQKERVRSAAREAALALGTAAVEAASHAVVGHAKVEAPIVVFERVTKENGLMAKSPRVREFVAHLLPQLRTAAPKLPLRPLLPSLVDLLSDADGPVREAARAACIALFSSAPAAAKADLKKELERKAVRKQTSDAVLAAVFAAPAAPAAAAAAEREREIPVPSTVRNAAASAAAGPIANALANAPDHALPPPATTLASEEGVPAVYIATRADLERTFAAMMPAFEGKETEHNWSAREQGCVKVRGMLRTGVHEQMPIELASHVHKLNEGIIKAVLSLRTTLAMHAITLISELAAALGEELHESIEYLLTNLLKMAGFTKKIVSNASQKAARDLMRNAHYRHKFLDLVWSYMSDKTVATRVHMCQHLVLLLDVFGQAHRHALEAHDGLGTMDKFLKKALPDQNKDVRAMARDAFARFQTIWPSEAAALIESLDPSTKKQIATAAAASGISLPSSVAQGAAAKPRTASAAAPRRPGGPSSALMAAKRAASERLARERREAEEAAAAGEAADEAPEEAEPAPRAVKASAPPSAFPRQQSTTPRGATSRPQSVVSPRASDVALPTTPRPGVLAQHARSASGSSSAGHATPRLGGAPASKMPPAAARVRTTSSSSSHVSSASHGSASASSGSRLASGAGAVRSRPPTALSPSSLKARSRTASASSSSAASARAAASAPGGGEEADETAQLADLDVDDASVDLMAFSSPLGVPSKFGAPPLKQGRSVEERTKLEAQAAEDSALHLLDLIEDPDTTLAMPATPTPAAVGAAATGAASPGTKRSGLPRPKSLVGTPRAATLGETQPGAASKNPAAPSTPGGKPLRVGGATSGAAWFLKRASRLDATLDSSPLKDKPEATQWAAEISAGTADLRTFRRLAKLSSEFKVPLVTPATEAEEVLRPGPRGAEGGVERMKREENEGREAAIEAWQQDHLFDRLWSALMLHLERPAKSEEVKSAGLVVLQRLVENQLPLIASTGKEAELLTLLFRLRRERERYTLNACDALIDAWTARTEPILGLGTLTASLSAALSDAGTAQAGDSARVRVYTLGLRSLGQVLLRLPPELVEEELPRAKALVKDAYNDANVDLRQAAVQVIIAAHQRLKDTAVLFALLAPLEPSQLDLLSYYLAKAKA